VSWCVTLIELYIRIASPNWVVFCFSDHQADMASVGILRPVYHLALSKTATDPAPHLVACWYLALYESTSINAVCWVLAAWACLDNIVMIVLIRPAAADDTRMAG